VLSIHAVWLMLTKHMFKKNKRGTTCMSFPCNLFQAS
jgi:hypothetical protein